MSDSKSAPQHPLCDYRPTLRDRLGAGETLTGLFLLTGSADVAEVCATLPLDWLLVDMEASPISKRQAVEMFRAITGSGVAPMVRVPYFEKHLVEHALDAGARGVLLPKVDGPERARALVDAACFPPAGTRGINPVRASGYFSDVPGYLEAADALALRMIQIESAEAVRNVGAITAVPGLDVAFIGCGDLAASLGQPGEVGGPRMKAAREAVLAACADSGVTPGIFAYGPELAAQYADEGFRFIAVGNDVKALRMGVDAMLGPLSRR